MSQSISSPTHGYADDTVEDLFGTNEDIPMDESRLPRCGQGERRDQVISRAQSATLLDGVDMCRG